MKLWLICAMVLVCSTAFARDGMQVYVGDDEQATQVDDVGYGQYTVELFGSGAVCTQWTAPDKTVKKLVVLRTDNLTIETKSGKRPKITVEQGKHQCKFKLWIVKGTDYGTVWIWLADGDTQGFEFVDTSGLSAVLKSVRSRLPADAVTNMIQQAYALETKAKK